MIKVLTLIVCIAYVVYGIWNLEQRDSLFLVERIYHKVLDIYYLLTL